MATKVIISPHLDDAALSMGGTVLQGKSKVKVITLCKSNWTLAGISEDIEGTTNIRLAEETTVIKRFKADFVFGGLPEATMRGYTDWMANCDIKKDAHILEQMINTINNNSTQEDELYFPAAIGEHVDHVLAFEAIKSLKNRNITLYEDLPYATYGGITERIEKISKLYKIKENLINITDTISDKLECLNVYKSQLTAEAINRVKCHAQSLNKDNCFYERTWTLAIK